MTDLDIRFLDSIDQLPAKQWNNLRDDNYPFIRYEFLAALENAADTTGGEYFVACSQSTGWQPQHIAIYKEQSLVACMPLYLKHHSYGEYIFDWAWADAYRRHNIDYYPKLLTAIPFSPVTGPRLLCAANVDRAAIYAFVNKRLQARCTAENLSSYHTLYLPKADSQLLSQYGTTQRYSFQYHWKNEHTENRPYTSFSDFLDTLKSRKRKAIKKERQSVVDAGIEFDIIPGEQIQVEHWETFYLYYQLTYLKRSGHGGYLPKAFFQTLGETMANQLVLMMAHKNGEYLAGALYLTSDKTLYGRYWGCSEHAEYLHFETCIYQGIEYCIANQLDTFDAGAQGEHKLQRGFRPVSTWSNHWIREPAFKQAIEQYVKQEQSGNMEAMATAETYLPYRHN